MESMSLEPKLKKESIDSVNLGLSKGGIAMRATKADDAEVDKVLQNKRAISMCVDIFLHSTWLNNWR